MIRCVAGPVRDAAFHRPLPLSASIPRSARETESMTSSRGWILATLALTGLALVLLFAVVPHRLSGDGYVRFVKLDALLREGTLARERYSYVGPLFAAPLWLLGDSRIWWCARFNVLTLAVGVGAAWWVLRPGLTSDERAASMLLLAATGMMPNATIDFYGEAFSAVMVGTGFALVFIKESVTGWLAVVLGVANMPASVGGVLLVAIWRFWNQRRLDGLAALLATGALIAFENTIVRGAPLNAGYAGDHGAVTVMPFSGMPGFSYPLILGLVSLLLSFGKGLLFFAPGLLLIRRARRDRPHMAPFFDASLLFLAGLLLVYSRWWAWYGGWTWGPRFLLFAAYPSALALAITLHQPTPIHRTITAMLLTVWTVWVGVSGAVFDLSGLGECTANGYAMEHLCWYVADFSPLLRPLVLPPDTLAGWQEAWMLLAAVISGVLITAAPSLCGTRDGANQRQI
jgi:hypothetical protein